MTRSGTDSDDVIRFMTQFARLKSWVDDDPMDLVSDAIRDESIRDICVSLNWDAYVLRQAEQRHPELFTAPVNPDFIALWRDYEKRYERVVNWVSSSVLFSDLGLGDGDVIAELSAERPASDTPDLIWQRADHDAAEAIEKMGIAMIFAENQIRVEDVWDEQPDVVEDVEAGIEGWNSLSANIGLDLRGILRRRALVPFVLVPRKIANQQGSTHRTALLQNLKEAQESFINGTLSACVALLRATVEVVLTEHFRLFGNDLKAKINSARGKLPLGVTVRELHELRELANRLLHSPQRDYDDILKGGDQLSEIRIVSLLITVRSLVEGVK